ncbi:MAG TPA: lantibiotic dehydratase [Solirubrobacteraceae bacterium]
MSREARPDGFLVLRTPLLPFDLLEGCSAGAEAPREGDDALDAALARDRAAFTARLHEILALPEVGDALRLASPDLAERLEPWVAGGAEPDAKLVRAALRYVARMCARPTPFGLMAGTTLGVLGQRTALELGPRPEARRRTTIDPQFVTALAERLSEDPPIRSRLRFRPSSALYEAGGRWRYARGRTAGARRTYELVAADGGAPLRVVVERARDGATAEALAAVLVEHGADAEQAKGYVQQLVDAQILEGDLVPPVTGEEPAAAFLARLGELDGTADGAATAAAGLAAARAALHRVDAAGLGAAPQAYDEVAAALEPLASGGLDPRRSLVAELVKPAARAELGRAVVNEVARAIDVLATLQPAQGSPALAAWRSAFRARWEDQEVPLVEALDEEIGIGFEASASPGVEASPLVRGLPWPPSEPEAARLGPRGLHLLRRVMQTVESGERELVLDEADLAALRHDEHAAVPDAFAPLFSVAVSDDDFRVRLHGAAGPSGARLLGRVCHADPQLAGAVRDHLRREEGLRPHAVFAEVAHLPEGRTGKLIARPLLRGHELEFLGRSGAPRDAVLRVDDLLVSVRGDRIVLRSRRLGCEVEPRLTSAYNYALASSLGIFRFLGTLQGQGVADGIVWNWGALDAAPFLPRVVEGRTVLDRARWIVRRDELRAAADARGDAERWRAVAALRERRRLPRWVALADGDNELVLDLDSVVAQDTLVRLAAPRPSIRLVELWPDPSELCVAGPDGRYTSELLVPFTRVREPVQPVPRPAPGAPVTRPRRFLPGGEWLYARLYTGSATADALLRDLVAPLVADAEQWFFIRYGDPDWHLRLRIRGDATAILPRLHAAAEVEARRGRLWKLELGTYEREQERYGGEEAVELCERVFHADSESALELMALVAGDAGADARWRLALAGIDRIMADLLDDPEAQHATVRRLRDAMAREHRADASLKKAVGARFRDERESLGALLRGDAEPAGGPLAAGLAILDRRSEAIAEPLAALRALAEAGRLEVTLPQLASDLAHMQTNRLLRSAHRAHEMVLYDVLDRLYMARAARRSRA